MLQVVAVQDKGCILLLKISKDSLEYSQHVFLAQLVPPHMCTNSPMTVVVHSNGVVGYGFIVLPVEVQKQQWV
jgi:hypothetical protein